MFHRTVLSVKVGQCMRYEVEYLPCSSAEEYLAGPPASLWLRIKNTEPLPMRAAYLAGPYVLYVDCRPLTFSTATRSFVTADQPQFEPQLHPGQVFYAELLCHTFQTTYRWSVDVVSQILFNTSLAINFELAIGLLRDMPGYEVPMPHLSVTTHDTLDLWNLPVPDMGRPVHLVILTHGLHSNVSADMLFLKEQIDRSKEENVVVKGFFNNVCKTERGIKYLGSRVADYVVELLKSIPNTTRISFVGHSLGGLVQTFAIAYLEINHSWVFDKVQPINFITLASPMLGVTHETPAYVKLALLAGVVGKTGQDLGLQYTEKDGSPLLLLLPSGPTHRVLKRFLRRTVYANVVNDGIVPLRTSALLYLDYEGISTLVGPEEAKGDEKAVDANGSAGDAKESSKIPRDLPQNEDSQTLAFQAMLSYFMPQKQLGDSRSNHFQTTTEGAMGLSNAYEKIPKTSMLESATSLILPPLPSLKYINDPDSRENVIIHDKIYTESDLPKDDSDRPGPTRKMLASERALELAEQDAKIKLKNEQPSRMMQMISSKSEGIRQMVQGNLTEHFEEDIAREYHKLMLWRKVLVKLKPDAHNNIVVRRRFSNAYGWPVIDHLVDNHFGVPEDNTAEVSKEDSVDLSTDGAELTQILSMDAIKRENEEIEKQPLEDGKYAWINRDNGETFFDGPAGIWSDISERMFKLKDDWAVNGMKVLTTSRAEDQTEEQSKGVVGEFL